MKNDVHHLRESILFILPIFICLKKNMFATLLILHSIIRWLLLATLIAGITRSYYGLKTNKLYRQSDRFLGLSCISIAHIQLLIGLSLYSLSPIVNYFLQNFKEGVHLREIRFFGMEHSLMMVIGVILISVATIKLKAKNNDRDKFKTILIWYSIALFIIFTSIPWFFSPLVNRPALRWFL
ncbi:hypothetical protein WH223_17885 [Sphingobacterium sp. MYb382]